MAKFIRKSLFIFYDFIMVNFSVLLALSLRFEGHVPNEYLNLFLTTIPILTGEKLLIYYIFGLYGSLWKYASVEELLKVVVATMCGSFVSFFIGYFSGNAFPEPVYIIAWMITVIMVGGIRVSYRILRRIHHKFINEKNPEQKRVLVIGAGIAGSNVIKELKLHQDSCYRLVAVLDDDPGKHGLKIHGVPVKGSTMLITEIVKSYKIDEIILAIPSASKKRVAEIAKICQLTDCRLKTLPAMFDIIDEKVSIQNIRDVSIEDLLGRDEVELNTAEIASYIQNETILVTGGGGSIGSEICRQIAKYDPKKLIILDIYENNAYYLQLELKSKFKKLDLEVVIASVRDMKRLEDVFERYRPGVVFHAAAHKHVPLMEANPAEAIKNNVFGTFNTAKCADKYGAKRFVLISTDKAVNPTNIMGASKRFAEMIIQALSKASNTEFVAVRFGNVLGSSGSVIPIFKKQIAEGGPVTVTHPDINRFFMTIPEAASLVIQAGAMAKGGEIFVLDMGEPVKIDQLARELIRLSGLKPDIDIKIEYTGLRPGEKLYEELMLAEEGIAATKQKGIHVAKPMDISMSELAMYMSQLEKCYGDPDELKETLARIVPTYSCNLAQCEAAAGESMKKDA